jgi:hypothetical protein
MLNLYIISSLKQQSAGRHVKVFHSPVWLLLHKLSSPHYRYIRKMRRGDRLPLTQRLILLQYNCIDDVMVFLPTSSAVECGFKPGGKSYQLLERASDNDLLLCRKSTSNKMCYRQWFDRCIISKMILKRVKLIIQLFLTCHCWKSVF